MALFVLYPLVESIKIKICIDPPTRPIRLATLFFRGLLILILVARCTTQLEENNQQKAFTVKTGPGKLVLTTSDSVLSARFEWAAQQALAYAHDEGDPVGKWYEAALPNREAFCMRDVSHQAVGGHLLGLQGHNKNMMQKFAANISDSKDWCTYWEINRYDQPAPVDYRNDNEFWYNLPANFDVLNSCYVLYNWTADQDYIQDSVFLNFYSKTVYDYVERWDLDIQKIMNRDRLMNLTVPLDTGDSFHVCRGLPSYGEGEPLKLYLGGDQLSLQYLGYNAYARIQEVRKEKAKAKEFFEKAQELKTFYNEKWWDSESDRYFTSLHTDGQFRSSPSRYLLTTGIGLVEGRYDQVLKDLLEIEDLNIESLSYFPQMFYENDQSRAAYDIILDLSSPSKERREYPEVSYAVVEAMVHGMMGLEPDAAASEVRTLPKLTPETDWVEFSNIPLFENKITVRHDGNTSSTFVNQEGTDLTWSPGFPGNYESLMVEGKTVPATLVSTPSGREVSSLSLPISAGQSVTVSVPGEYETDQ